MDRTRAAEPIDDEIARIVSALDRHLAHQVGHVMVGDLDDSCRRVAHTHIERPGDFLLDRLDRQRAIQLQVTTEEIVGIDVAQNNIGIGHRGVFAAAAVTGRTRIRPGALRPDPQPTETGQGDRAAAGADRHDVNRRHEQRVLADCRCRRDYRLAVDDQADVEAGAADVGADDVPVPQQFAQEPRCHHATRGTRGERVDRPTFRVGGAHCPAHGLHHE